jgi:uncharacterized damage-inducible protein DinB
MFAQGQVAKRTIPLTRGVYMPKIISTLLNIGLTALIVTVASAQESKTSEPPRPAASPSDELLRQWHYVLGKVVAMAEDCPQDKYEFKAQKDQRTFGENLLHIAAAELTMMSAMKGAPTLPFGKGDTLGRKYTTKDGIVKVMKLVVAEGEQLIKEQGDAGLIKEVKYPGVNAMVHGSFLWYSILEHTGEHYGQLVVYYRVNGMIPPDSRPNKQ